MSGMDTRHSRHESGEVIDRDEFKPKAELTKRKPNGEVWLPRKLRPVPAFYPLEKSTRLVEDDSAPVVADRLSERLRTLSVYAIYDDESATASLLTSENVEMHLSLWQTPAHSMQQGVLVELQRRKGDSITFHRYSRSILDAAVAEDIVRDIMISPADDIVYSRKVQRLLAMELGNQDGQEHENAIIAIEIAHSLLMKDRMDARQLGLESLCLLTDPSKTGQIAATLTAHVVLLGSTQGVNVPGVTPPEDSAADSIMMNEGPFQEIREAVLSLVQFSRIGEEDLDEATADVDRMEVSYDKEQMTLLHNLALAVLANALDVIEQKDRTDDDDDDDDEPEDTKPRARLRTSSTTDVAEEFMNASKSSSSKEIMSTLISELGKAQDKPHDAHLSAKCIGSLCRASAKAKRRAKELGAKQVVATALEVGVKSHLKLETECKKVATVLNAPTHEEEDR